MLDLPLAAGLALIIGQLAPTSPIPVAVAATVVVFLAWNKLGALRVALLGGCFFFGSYRSSATVAEFNSAYVASRDAFGPPAGCSGVVRVETSPVKRGDVYSFVSESVSMECEEGRARVAQGTKLRLYASFDGISRGDLLDVVIRAAPVEIPRNFEIEGGLAYAAGIGATLSGTILGGEVIARKAYYPSCWIDLARAHARRRIVASYPPDAVPMTRALVLGENDLPEEDAEAFRLSGLSHLLAVSGTHVVLAVFGIVKLLIAVMVRIEPIAARCDAGRIASAIGVPLVWVYAEFAGGGGSVRRAALMATVVLSARAMARVPNGVRAFGLSLLAGALVDPLAAFDVSFGLSGGATAGLLLASRPLAQKLEKLPRPFCWVAEPVAATVSSSAFCLPWLLLLGPQLSLVGVAANILAVPVGELVSLPACLVHLLLSTFPSAERGIALLGSGSLLLVRMIARCAADLEFLAFDMPRPTDWQIVVIGVASVSILLRPKLSRVSVIVVAVFLLVTAEVLAVVAEQPKGKLRVTVLDVGQGDSTVVDFPDGRAMIVDGGGVVGSPVDPGKRTVSPVLRTRRRSRMSIAVISHPHPDHFMGLASVLPKTKIGQLWDTGQGEIDGAGPIYEGILSGIRARAIPIRRPADLCGKRFSFGEAHMRVLGPCPDIVPGRGGNDNSFILHIKYHERAALLVGDAELEQEEDLLKLRPSLLKSDFLKVGHHGSRTSTSPRFLEAVAPTHAIITSGVRNRYGHPTAQVMNTLANHGVKLYRSDRHGALRWETDGHLVEVTTAVSLRPY